MPLHDLATTGAAVAGTSGRPANIDSLAALLQRLAPEEVDVAIAFLSGTLRQGRVGIGPAAIMGAKSSTAADEATLRLVDVDQVFERMAATS